LQKDWDIMAQLDPLWMVLNERDKRYGRWDPDEFFATGEQEIAQALARCNVHPAEALDYGCGVGRLTRALAGRFERCLGLDFSPGMIEQARRYNGHLANCEFRSGTLAELPPGSFDFIYCARVLQHMKRPEIYEALRQFVRLLKPGGTALFQLPYFMPLWKHAQPRRRGWEILSALGASPRFLNRMGFCPIPMIAVKEQQVRAIIEGAGGRILRAEEDDKAGSIFKSLCYEVKRASPVTATSR